MLRYYVGTKIKLGGTTMKVKIYNESWEVKEVTQEELTDGDKIYYGSCQDQKSLIRVLKDLDTQRKRSVLIHEVAHAIFSITQCANEDLSEELVVEFIAAHIDEISNVVKEYFKPKKKVKRNVKTKTIVDGTSSGPEVQGITATQ